MRTIFSEQSDVWQAAFNEGLARGEAAFGPAHGSAISFAESYAYLVEAEHLKANAATEDTEPMPTEGKDTRAGWAKAFGAPRSGSDANGGPVEGGKTGWAKAFGRTAE